MLTEHDRTWREIWHNIAWQTEDKTYRSTGLALHLYNTAGVIMNKNLYSRRRNTHIPILPTMQLSHWVTLEAVICIKGRYFPVQQCDWVFGQQLSKEKGTSICTSEASTKLTVCPLWDPESTNESTRKKVESTKSRSQHLFCSDLSQVELKYLNTTKITCPPD